MWKSSRRRVGGGVEGVVDVRGHWPSSQQALSRAFTTASASRVVRSPCHRTVRSAAGYAVSGSVSRTVGSDAASVLVARRRLGQRRGRRPPGGQVPGPHEYRAQEAAGGDVAPPVDCAGSSPALAAAGSRRRAAGSAPRAPGRRTGCGSGGRRWANGSSRASGGLVGGERQRGQRGSGRRWVYSGSGHVAGRSEPDPPDGAGGLSPVGGGAAAGGRPSGGLRRRCGSWWPRPLPSRRSRRASWSGR